MIGPKESKASISEVLAFIEDDDRKLEREVRSLDWLTQTAAEQSGYDYKLYELRRSFLEVRQGIELLFSLEHDVLFPRLSALDAPPPNYWVIYGPLDADVDRAQGLYRNLDTKCASLAESASSLSSLRETNALTDHLLQDISGLSHHVSGALAVRRTALLPQVAVAAAHLG